MSLTKLNAVDEKVKENCEKTCKAQYKTLEDKLLYPKAYSRRENLRFYGIQEEGEQEDSLCVLTSFLESKLQVETIATSNSSCSLSLLR